MEGVGNLRSELDSVNKEFRIARWMLRGVRFGLRGAISSLNIGKDLVNTRHATLRHVMGDLNQHVNQMQEAASDGVGHLTAAATGTSNEHAQEALVVGERVADMLHDGTGQNVGLHVLCAEIGTGITGIDQHAEAVRVRTGEMVERIERIRGTIGTVMAQTNDVASSVSAYRREIR